MSYVSEIYIWNGFIVLGKLAQFQALDKILRKAGQRRALAGN